MQLILYRYRYYDEIRRKWTDTRYGLTEAEAAVHYPGATRLDHTKEVIERDENAKPYFGTGHFMGREQ